MGRIVVVVIAVLAGLALVAWIAARKPDAPPPKPAPVQVELPPLPAPAAPPRRVADVLASPARRTLRIPHGTTTPIPKPVTGNASVAVTAIRNGMQTDAMIKVDGVLAGESPQMIELPAGTHIIEVSDKLRRLSKRVVLKPGETRELRLDLGRTR